jgi:hypothetical protein
VRRPVDFRGLVAGSGAGLAAIGVETVGVETVGVGTVGVGAVGVGAVGVSGLAGAGCDPVTGGCEGCAFPAGGRRPGLDRLGSRVDLCVWARLRGAPTGRRLEELAEPAEEWSGAGSSMVSVAKPGS